MQRGCASLDKFCNYCLVPLGFAKSVDHAAAKPVDHAAAKLHELHELHQLCATLVHSALSHSSHRTCCNRRRKGCTPPLSGLKAMARRDGPSPRGQADELQQLVMRYPGLFSAFAPCRNRQAITQSRRSGCSVGHIICSLRIFRFRSTHFRC